jgi:ERF superfamily.
MTLNEKLATIQTKFKSKKSRFNSFGKYNFRSAEDILEATKPYLLELGVSVTITERIIVSEPFPILESKAVISDGDGAIHATSIVGVDLAQKGMQMPQKFGSASSYGKKYALGNLFLIDDTADSDATNNHDKGNVAKPKLQGAALVKAKAFIKSGGSMEAVKKKYDIPADVLNTL